MKRLFLFLLAVSLLLTFAACNLSVQQEDLPSVLNASSNVAEKTSGQQAKEPSVLLVAQDERLYYCEECNAECSYYVGQFLCPAVNRNSKAAEAVNEEIEAAYNKYVDLAKMAAQGESGLAYGFTYTAFENEKFVIIRTSVATVMLHEGGTYSYDVYYYDLEKDAAADAESVCAYFGLDVNVIASYVRLELAESGEYSQEQIDSVTAEFVDIFPLGDAFYVKVKNDRVKYEKELTGEMINERAVEIASELADRQEREKEAEESEDSDDETDTTEERFYVDREDYYRR